jgi:hypothetical protein
VGAAVFLASDASTFVTGRSTAASSPAASTNVGRRAGPPR